MKSFFFFLHKTSVVLFSQNRFKSIALLATNTDSFFGPNLVLIYLESQTFAFPASSLSLFIFSMFFSAGWEKKYKVFPQWNNNFSKHCFIFLFFFFFFALSRLKHLEQNCGCISLDLKSCDLYSCSASPVTPAAAFLAGNDTVFVYNYHAFSASVDWLYPCYFLSSISCLCQKKCNITATRKPNERYKSCFRPRWYKYFLLIAFSLTHRMKINLVYKPKNNIGGTYCTVIILALQQALCSDKNLEIAWVGLASAE